MFYGQCNTCGERWELGTASTCKCLPLPDYKFDMKDAPIDWTTASIPLEKMATLSTSDIKPNYNMQFHKDGKQIGMLDWNGPQMVFTGDMEESAKMFFDWVAKSFAGRLEQERKAAREWVGLTQQDIDIAFDDTQEGGGFDDFARAIEAKLREKNA